MSVPAVRPVIVHGLPPLWGAPSASPFVVKLLTWLRMAEIPYEAPPLAGPPRSPTKKMPYVELPDGTLLGDSALIIEELGRRSAVTMDDVLDARQRAEALALRRMLEEHLYFAGLWERWISPDGRAASRRDYFAFLPWPLRSLLPILVSRDAKRNLYGHGLGRHTPADIYAMAFEDIDAAATLLGDRDYLFDVPTSIDAATYGLVRTVLANPFPSPLADRVRGHANLVAYGERITARWWPDMPILRAPKA